MEVANGRSKLVELENIITEFQDQLFRFAFFRTGSFADSQDIVQEVFIKLYHENGNLQTVNNIKNYLYRSISNACIDFSRKSRKLKFEPIDKIVLPINMHENEASHNLIQIEEYNRLKKLLSELPNEQSETIRLRVFDNLSFVEIAEILEVPVTTIKSRFKYGIEKLKNRFATVKEVNYGL
ncbi:MAG: RNA polymerase sigma factor [Bacteroidota bacterium]|nr:RNA polymerase sigma factor [Bacteroidota bacterium]MDP4275641.1 RNA polymerase sigma factor [Bacteroidota bacterium]